MNATNATGPDVVDVLTTDHREAEELIGRIMTEVDAGQRREAADLLIAELVRHAVAEEMFVYPAMRKHLPQGDEAVEHDIQEHQELEELMKQLEGADANEARFLELVEELRRVLDDHVQDEENVQFPKLRAHLPQDDLVALAGKVDAAKKVAPTRPHPGAPNSALFHLLAGPGVGFIDRLRDRLTNRPT
ncbi:hemerythrin domain-containing protein [Kribbella sp. CA-293567]|uniref:hemerythrin domain-containing protein n=1 Tax=Kribbella sp. CA-293567 TaxID=3002436 RepID=UPI0022DD4B04|nr:hemerythrin domain-containing protein [Kribbella sp. CA-293567]WBQ04497.1 hemerythrin domain-containing protein [Kribbella sp. CA-293567]